MPHQQPPSHVPIGLTDLKPVGGRREKTPYEPIWRAIRADDEVLSTNHLTPMSTSNQSNNNWVLIGRGAAHPISLDHL